MLVTTQIVPINSAPPAHSFVSRTEYFQQLTKDIESCRRGDRVALATMSYDPDEPLVFQLMRSLTAAAERGVVINLVVDAFSFLINGKTAAPGPLWFRGQMPRLIREPFRTRLMTLQRLSDAGGRYVISNAPMRRFSLPHAGRSHIKTAVVNDRIFIGGHNLSQVDEIDVMTCWQEPDAADWIHATVEQIVDAGSTGAVFGGTDRECRLGPGRSLLLDAGIPGQSLILDEAMKFIDEAQECIFLSCQFFPGGRTAQRLLQAHRRGVRVRILYSHPRVHGIEAPAHRLHLFYERTRLPRSFFANQMPKHAHKVHAKLLVTEQGAMLGSHNYVTQGVRLGTAEIALQLRGPEFGEAALAALLSQLEGHGAQHQPTVRVDLKAA
jgi:phosphatidylserine/phosphatidylglycerophosphate/cardiolipin synthase-like enzyme